MTIKYFTDSAGRYLGGFGGIEPPGDAIEVPTPPGDARQLWDGTTWLPKPPTVPQSVLKRQGRAALIIAGHEDGRDYIAEIEAYLATMEGIEGDLARDEWNSSQAWERHRPLTIQMGQLLGFTPERMDELFTFAATL